MSPNNSLSGTGKDTGKNKGKNSYRALIRMSNNPPNSYYNPRLTGGAPKYYNKS